MRFINVYLVGYAVFLLGVILALGKAGILHRMGPAWVAIGAVVAVGVGIMLSVKAGKPTITRE